MADWHEAIVGAQKREVMILAHEHSELNIHFDISSVELTNQSLLYHKKTSNWEFRESFALPTTHLKA